MIAAIMEYDKATCGLPAFDLPKMAMCDELMAISAVEIRRNHPRCHDSSSVTTAFHCSVGRMHKIKDSSCI